MEETPEKIIIRMPNWIGDFVMATPILKDLRKKYPKAEITAMCQEPLSELLKEDKHVDEVFSFSKKDNQFLRRKQKRSIIKKIREGSFDLGILLTNSFSSAWWFYRGRVKKTIGFSKDCRGLLLSKAIPFLKNSEHQVETYKRLLEPLEIEKSNTLPYLDLSEQEIAYSKELLVQRGVTEKNQVIGIHTGAAFGPAKRWPEEKFFQLAKKLLENPNIRVVFVGDEAVSPMVKKITRALGVGIVDLTGTTTLRSLCSVMSLFDVFVTNDSGPMHIAAALKIPLIALFGSTSPEKTGPYKHGDVIYKNVACSPCFKRVCPIDFPCMEKIEVNEVHEKILALLAK